MNLQTRFDASSPADSIQAAIEEHGYAIVEGVLNKADLAEMNGQIGPYLAITTPDTENPFNGALTMRFGRLLWRIPKVRQLVQHPIIIGALDRTLRPYSPAYHLSFTGVMHVTAGEIPQVLHRDNTIFENTPEMPINLLAVMCAAQDFRRENGATVFVPGSHKWFESREPKREELLCAEMPAGSILVYAGNLIHGSGKCVVGTRTGVSLQYSLSWMNQEESQFLATPPEYAARHFDEPLLRLIGYDTISRNCGEIDSKHLLDFLLQDGKKRSLATPGNEYSNGTCRSLFFHAGAIRTADHHYHVTLDD